MNEDDLGHGGAIIQRCGLSGRSLLLLWATCSDTSRKKKKWAKVQKGTTPSSQIRHLVRACNGACTRTHTHMHTHKQATGFKLEARQKVHNTLVKLCPLLTNNHNMIQSTQMKWQSSLNVPLTWHIWTRPSSTQWTPEQQRRTEWTFRNGSIFSLSTKRDRDGVC